MGSMRVAMPVTYGRLCLGPHVVTFLRRHPRLSLELMLSDAMLDLGTERFDLAVRIGVPAVYAAYLPNRRHSRKVQALVELLLQRAVAPLEG
jgi:DNA-binding transcriptional LysR family regulator